MTSGPGVGLVSGRLLRLTLDRSVDPNRHDPIWMPRRVHGRGSSQRRGLVGGISGHAGGPDPPCPDPPITPPKGCLNQVPSWEFRNRRKSFTPRLLAKILWDFAYLCWANPYSVVVGDTTRLCWSLVFLSLALLLAYPQPILSRVAFKSPV